MSTDESLSDYVAAEIRAMIARKRTSGRGLAERLGVSRSWVSYRLTGNTEITLTDLERIAAALNVQVAELLPPRGDVMMGRSSPATRPATRALPHPADPRSARTPSRRRAERHPPRPAWTHTPATA
jgi:transcriptional regulator with XRE-family HTH domain